MVGDAVDNIKEGMVLAVLRIVDESDANWLWEERQRLLKSECWALIAGLRIVDWTCWSWLWEGNHVSRNCEARSRWLWSGTLTGLAEAAPFSDSSNLGDDTENVILERRRRFSWILCK